VGGRVAAAAGGQDDDAGAERRGGEREVRDRPAHAARQSAGECREHEEDGEGTVPGQQPEHGGPPSSQGQCLHAATLALLRPVPHGPS
jgi:hypothetical protein